MSSAFSADELRARQAVWEALSAFWLDTELEASDLEHIAERLAASPYSLAELAAIHQHEVAPAVAANLTSVAGEWAGFDQAWLARRCQEHALRRRDLRHRIGVWLRRPMLAFFAAHHWRRVGPRILALRREAGGVGQ